MSLISCSSGSTLASTPPKKTMSFFSRRDITTGGSIGSAGTAPPTSRGNGGLSHAASFFIVSGAFASVQSTAEERSGSYCQPTTQSTTERLALGSGEVSIAAAVRGMPTSAADVTVDVGGFPESIRKLPTTSSRRASSCLMPSTRHMSGPRPEANPAQHGIYEDRDNDGSCLMSYIQCVQGPGLSAPCELDPDQQGNEKGGNGGDGNNGEASPPADVWHEVVAKPIPHPVKKG